jgi:hypothetical protein
VEGDKPAYVRSRLRQVNVPKCECNIWVA